MMKKKSDLAIYLRLLTYVKPHIGIFIVSIIGYAIASSSQPMLANSMKYFIDSLRGQHGKFFSYIPYLDGFDIAYAIPFILVIISVWQGIGSFIGGYFLSKVSLNLIQDIRMAMFDKFLTLPTTYFNSQNSGAIAAGVIYAANSITAAATNAIQVVFREGLTVIFLLGYLFYMNWRLTLTLFIIFPVVIVIVIKTARKFRSQSIKIQNAMGKITSVSKETISNYKVVKVFGGKDYEYSRFMDANDYSVRQSIDMAKTSAVYTPKLQIILYTSMALLLLLILFFRGNATVGELLAYVTAIALLPKSIRQLSGVSSTIQKGLAGAEAIFGLLDHPEELDEGMTTKAKVFGKIEAINLSFTYPHTSNTILNNINFTCESGQMIAIVGKSGAGKSTLASLLLRFYLSTSGKILLDGIDINDYTLANLRKHIALVSQDITLFNTTIFSNIAYGELSEVTFDQVKNAARLAYADEFIELLPEGYNTVVGENGLKLSGGQRQRIALARAFLKNAPILILDEATSALDNQSESLIQLALDKAMHNKTTIVIAHRLSTIRKADKILVLDEGQVVEEGTHDQLIGLNGVYANLVLGTTS